MSRPPKPEDERQSKNRVYFYEKDKRLKKLGLKDRFALKALLNTLLDDYESKLEHEQTGKKG